MQKKLLTNGNAFKRTDGRWCGVVWYMDERGERKRKSFSGTTKAEVNKKITEYIADFDKQAIESDESKKTLQDNMQNWLQGVKEVARRNGADFTNGREVKIGKPKSETSKRTVPLNRTAVAMIESLRREAYFGENTPLVADGNGGYTRPVNFRKRYYRILKAAEIKQKGLHSLRHTFATNLVNGQKQSDGTIKALSPRQVADLLGHSTSQITELYYVKKDTARLNGITEGFEI